jgi:hypothetical protein
MAKKKPRAEDTLEAPPDEELLESMRETPPEPVFMAPVVVAPPPPTPKAPSSSVQHFKVARQAVFVVNGNVITLHAGSIVSSATHNVEELRGQGVPLDPCDAPSAGLDAYGRPKSAAYQEPR